MSTILFPLVCSYRLLSFIGGEAFGGWGSGRSDCRMLLYALSGLDSWLARPLRLSIAEGDIPVASLKPRLWLGPFEAAEDKVLVRLRSKGPEYAE